MAPLQTTQDNRLDSQHTGSVLLTVGGILLGMALLLGIYTFQDIREGTSTLLWTVSVLTVIGLVLVAFGAWKRNRGY